MKKFISLALAAAMTLSLVPVSAFASTDNRISNVVTVSKDDILGEDVKSNVPSIVIVNDKQDIAQDGDFSFELVLDGAEWDDVKKVTAYEENQSATNTITGETSNELVAQGKVVVDKISSTRALVKVDVNSTKPDANTGLRINLNGVKVTGDKATVSIDPRQSTVSADTFTFAKAVDGGTIVTNDGTKDFSDGDEVKDIFVEEVTAGSLKTTDITLKLNSGFKFAAKPTVTNAAGDIVPGEVTIDGRDCTIKITSNDAAKGTSILKISGIKIAEDGADFGKAAEITVSGTNVDKTTLEVGTYVDYGVSVTAADKDLPVIYSGVAVDDDNNETLAVTLKENVVGSWLTNRKTTITFPEGVKVKNVKVDDYSNITKPSDLDGASASSNDNFVIDGNEVTINGIKVDSGKKAELSLKFDLIVAPDFTGDIKCTVGGAALAEDTEVTVAKAVAPVTVEADKTSVAIDYRNVAVGDITIKEAEAGLWGKGQTIILSAENMSFESGMKAEIVEGDGEIKKLEVNKGTIKITVDSESSKTPMTIKLTDASLYLDRTLPAGDYALNLVSGENAVMFETYDSDDGNKPSETDKFGFDVDEVEVLGDYVTVATAGRDQGTTFTTNVVVTIDSTTMLVDGKEVTLDVPAYLSAEGWTMLPVRAVTEALATSSNSEPIDWIAGNPGTIMIYYGDKTVSMTLGSTTMYINGTPVPMSTAPVIVNDRAFLPMRDLGRALGLSDSQIAWDATARTATFNPVAEAK